MKVEDLTICDSTAQMITKARKEGVELLFDRANDMKKSVNNEGTGFVAGAEK